MALYEGETSDQIPGSDLAVVVEERQGHVEVGPAEDRRLPAVGPPFERLISMNRPLHHRGYVFFQSRSSRARMMSILSVARAPGLPVVYAGTALLTLGVAWYVLRPAVAGPAPGGAVA